MKLNLGKLNNSKKTNLLGHPGLPYLLAVVSYAMESGEGAISTYKSYVISINV